MLFHKFQALGNDFLIVRESALRDGADDFEVFSKQICDRHFGAGADGVELLLDSPRGAGADLKSGCSTPTAARLRSRATARAAWRLIFT